MEIKLLKPKGFSANCYILQDGDYTAVIDPGEYYEEAKIALNNSKHKYILLTHPHFDHILGLYKLWQETGAKVVISSIDSVGLLEDNEISLVKETGNFMPSVKADILVNDNDKLPFGDDFLTVIATPGHTNGSVCYKYKDALFTGDTLFCDTVGRTDLPSGDFYTLLKSLKKLKDINEDLRIYPGHENQTTLKREKERNPYMKRI